MSLTNYIWSFKQKVYPCQCKVKHSFRQRLNMFYRMTIHIKIPKRLLIRSWQFNYTMLKHRLFVRPNTRGEGTRYERFYVLNHKALSMAPERWSLPTMCLVSVKNRITPDYNQILRTTTCTGPSHFSSRFPWVVYLTNILIITNIRLTVHC